MLICISNLTSKILNVLNELNIFVHNVKIVFSMQHRLFLKVIFKLEFWVDKVHFLRLKLLFNLTVDLNILLFHFTDVLSKVFRNTYLKLLVVIDMLRNPIDGIFLRSYFWLINTDSLSKFLNFILCLILFCSSVVNCKAETCTRLVEVL